MERFSQSNNYIYFNCTPQLKELLNKLYSVGDSRAEAQGAYGPSKQ